MNAPEAAALVDHARPNEQYYWPVYIEWFMPNLLCTHAAAALPDHRRDDGVRRDAWSERSLRLTHYLLTCLHEDSAQDGHGVL